ncbi:unnamed protein product [Rhizophagus irregularis]|nr:unnamed protein product [Rhizophagus irregularis]
MIQAKARSLAKKTGISKVFTEMAFNLPSNTTVEHRAKMRHLYDYWMNNEAIKEYTPSGKIKRPSYSLVANWSTKINNKERGIEADDESHEESSDNDYEPGDNRSDDSGLL